MERPGFVILLRHDRHVDPRIYGDEVAARTGLSKLEARLAVRKGRGVFLEGLSEEAARALAAQLEADGIEARAVPADSLPPLPAPRRITQIEASDDFLTLRTPSGEEDIVPWEAFGLVHFGAVVQQMEYRQFFEAVPFEMMPALQGMEEAAQQLLKENLILKMDAPPPDRRLKHERAAESAFHAADTRYRGKLRLLGDLVTEDLGTRLRVAMDELAWGTGEFKIGGPAAMAKLATRLRERRPEVFSEPALRLLDAADIREHVFPDIEEYNRTLAWCAWKGLIWPNAATSSPSPEPPASSTDDGSSKSSPGPGPAST